MRLRNTSLAWEIPGGDHMNVIAGGMPNIFAFFAQHARAR
jgi:hypothetical protein